MCVGWPNFKNFAIIFQAYNKKIFNMNRSEVIANKRKAEASNEKRYMGNPCKYGHSGIRWVASNVCVECRRSVSSKQTDLKYRNTHSELIQNYKRDPNRIFLNLIRLSKHSAKQRGYSHTINVKDIESLWETQGGLCYYTGAPMSKVSGRGRPNPIKATVDRIDSSNGYILGNVVLCTSWANVAKSDSTLQYFITMCQSVSANASHLLTSNSIL